VERETMSAAASTIPTSIPATGGSYSYTFNGTLNASWNEQHINYVGILHKNSGIPENSGVVNGSVFSPECSANFYLVADSLIPHHYWAVSMVSGAQPLNYVWSWGDGSYDSTAYPSHTYSVAGYYTLCLS